MDTIHQLTFGGFFESFGLLPGPCGLGLTALSSAAEEKARGRSVQRSQDRWPALLPGLALFENCFVLGLFSFFLGLSRWFSIWFSIGFLGLLNFLECFWGVFYIGFLQGMLSRKRVRKTGEELCLITRAEQVLLGSGSQQI